APSSRPRRGTRHGRPNGAKLVPVSAIVWYRGPCRHGSISRHRHLTAGVRGRRSCHDAHAAMLEGGRLRIALLGTRGVPASYSGFETCAEELGSRLVARGHEVTVYCRVPHVSYPGRDYRGMRLVKLPTVRSKHFDTIVHAVLSSVHACAARYDVALYFNVGVSP